MLGLNGYYPWQGMRLLVMDTHIQLLRCLSFKTLPSRRSEKSFDMDYISYIRSKVGAW